MKVLCDARCSARCRVPRHILRHVQLVRFVVCIAAFVFATGSGLDVLAQCVVHPDGKTAVRLNNESSHELIFFVDYDEKGMAVAARTVSPEVEVGPGEHLLRAKAIVWEQSLWVWALNVVPGGQLCTWTVTDPQRTGNKENYNDEQSYR